MLGKMKTWIVAATVALLSIVSAAPQPRAESMDLGPRGDGFAVFRWLVAIGLGDVARDRLIGQGGRWEQAAISCERPRVALALAPSGAGAGDEPKFELTIESRCRGQAHESVFSGLWEARGSDQLVLTFPEPGGLDEALLCPIARCDDGAGEDCITCRVAADLSFELRVVRR
jgi:hypothetical protein